MEDDESLFTHTSHYFYDVIKAVGVRISLALFVVLAPRCQANAISSLIDGQTGSSLCSGDVRTRTKESGTPVLPTSGRVDIEKHSNWQDEYWG